MTKKTLEQFALELEQGEMLAVEQRFLASINKIKEYVKETEEVLIKKYGEDYAHVIWESKELINHDWDEFLTAKAMEVAYSKKYKELLAINANIRDELLVINANIREKQ